MKRLGERMPDPTLITGNFSDSDELRAAATAAGLDIEFRQLDRGTLDARLELAIGAKLVVQRFELGRRFHQSGAVPSGLLTFGLPDNVEKLTWYGRRMKRDSILNFSRRDGFDAVSNHEFNGYTFSIRASAFQSAVSALNDLLPAQQVHDMADHFSASDSDIRRARALARGLRHCLKNQAAGTRAYSELELDLAHILAQRVCASSDVETRSSFAGRQLAVNKALELILSGQDDATLSDIYKHCAVSRRTLDRAFKERFGVTPKQYIVAVRLLGLRRALLSASPGTKIADIANDWGFWHLGRLSSDYNRMFGELPSRTLKTMDS